MKPIVEFDGVSKWYGNVIGLNKISIHVPAGVTGLLGPNGAGKSTLLQLATGQLYPSQGTVTVLGERVNLASRLCSQARAMEVIIDDQTRERAGSGVEVEALPPLTLKGFTDSVQAYRLLKVATE